MTFYQATRCHTPQDSGVHLQQRDNLQSHREFITRVFLQIGLGQWNNKYEKAGYIARMEEMRTPQKQGDNRKIKARI
jgi:hypothetical protein